MHRRPANPEPVLAALLAVGLLAGFSPGLAAGPVGPPPVAADEPVGGEGTPTAPSLRFGENDVDYGTLLQGEVVEHALEIHNDGGATLLLTRAEPSCSCTGIVELPREIPVGGTGTVRFTVDSKRIQPGDTRKRIRFETNDPLQPRAEFYFTAEVLSLYRSEPGSVRLSGLFDREKSARIRLVGTTEHGFELIGARSRGGLFEITDFVEVKAGTYELELAAGPVAAPESVRDPLDILIRVRDGREIQIGQWVDIDHLDPIEVMPEGALQFENRDTDPLLDAGAQPVTKSVFLRSRDPDRTFRVLGVRLVGLPEGAFETRLDTIAEGKTYAVRVTLPAYRDEAFLLGKLLIDTDAQIGPLRELHLRAKFGRKR